MYAKETDNLFFETTIIKVAQPGILRLTRNLCKTPLEFSVSYCSLTNSLICIRSFRSQLDSCSIKKLLTNLTHFHCNMY